MKNEEHYTRVRIEEIDKGGAELKKFNWWRVTWITVMLILFYPILPTRHSYKEFYPKNATEYFEQLWVPILVAAAFGLYFWKEVKPSLHKQKYVGYILRGQFVVIGKNNQFGQTKLKLQPGTSHSIPVDKNFYKFINVGDQVLVERNLLGDMINVSKI